MNLEELNDILIGMHTAPSREKAFEFAFGLLRWMKLEPVDPNKEAPLPIRYTATLKELTEDPRVKRGQFYRITKPDQKISVRLVVMKNINKRKAIQLIVKKEVSVRSFQSEHPVFIPTSEKPYFIHLITTLKYDQMLFVLNQGDQMRVILFRNKLSNTQYYKIVEKWKDIALMDKKTDIQKTFWDTLDISEVNKQFYINVKEKYDGLVDILRLYDTDIYERQTLLRIQKQFATRLIGRYVFCWFLKEKGIIPAGLINSRAIEETKNYYQLILEKLFFETLNKKVSERILISEKDALPIHKYFEKIPYLNGGLFEKSEEDRIFSNLSIDEWLISFVKVLENYDFTVDESSVDFQQVAIDPEMLGRIFENLLASQNPETEKIANNDRKNFGAFYTPREIVNYMVDESIKTFLIDKLKVSPEELTSAFSNNPQWPEKLKDRKNEAELALKQIKILDPACGSGAFPMGALKRLVSLRELVGFHPYANQLKKQILSENIYGVDIMPMAIELARLRAWLTLIVEEKYDPAKPHNNFEIDSLPNLDFKFMQGNSLLETYEGIKLFDEKLLDESAESGRQENLARIREKIKLLQNQYITLHSKNKLKPTDKYILEKEINENKARVIYLTKKEENPYDLLFVEERISKTFKENLKQLHKDYFSASDQEQKKNLKIQIEEMEWMLIESTLKEQKKEDKLKELIELRIQNIKPYFLFKLNFPEVFERGGFDVVVGNPPYVNVENIDIKTKKHLFENYKTIKGRTDIYIAFIEKTLELLKKNGIFTFIIPYPYTNQNYGSLSRKMLIENYFIREILDTSEYYVFETAIVKNVILSIVKYRNKETTSIKIAKSKNDFHDNSFKTHVLNQNLFLKLKDYRFETKNIIHALKLKSKIWINSIRLDEICLIAYGARLNHKSEYICKENYIFQNFKKGYKPFAEGKNIERYKYTQHGWLNYQPKEHYNAMFPELFENDKICFINIVKDRLRFAFDKNKFYNSHTVINCVKWDLLKNATNLTVSRNISEDKIIKATNYNYLFLLGILNSNFINWYFLHFLSESLHFYPDDAKELPIPNIDLTKQHLLISIVEKILSEKTIKIKSEPLELDKEIDVLVYKLYELTYEEVKVVDKDFWMSEGEYKDLKIN